MTATGSGNGAIRADSSPGSRCQALGPIPISPTTSARLNNNGFSHTSLVRSTNQGARVAATRSSLAGSTRTRSSVENRLIYGEVTGGDKVEVLDEEFGVVGRANVAVAAPLVIECRDHRIGRHVLRPFRQEAPRLRLSEPLLPSAKQRAARRADDHSRDSVDDRIALGAAPSLVVEHPLRIRPVDAFKSEALTADRAAQQREKPVGHFYD